MQSLTSKIFITGKVNGASVDELNEFALAAQELKKLGFTNVTTAAEDLPSGDELGNPDAENHYLRTRNKRAGEADTVLYLINYEEDKKAKLDVLAASYIRNAMSIGTFIRGAKEVSA